jgi:biopolymer transport protein ExbD
MIKVKRVSNKLNIAGSMTDISFLLIIFFLVSAMFIADDGLVLTLPDKQSRPLELYPDQAVIIHIEEMNLSVNNRAVSYDRLEQELEQIFLLRNDLVVIIEVSGNVSYEEVMSALEIAKRAGGNIFSIKCGKDSGVPVEVKGQS